jgi:hypothetical protein
MTTTAATWFYRAPEKTPYLLEERVRTSFWDQRLGTLWLNTVSVESPVAMAGEYNGAQVKMEWEPAHWLRLSVRPAQPTLVQGVKNLLQRNPTLRYDDAEGGAVWEWRVDDADQRWQALQGQPAFGNLQRLDKQK